MQDAALLSSRYFGGTARLYEDEALARFSHTHVYVVGVGGVGSRTVEALARSGISRLALIDLGNVAEPNVSRQLHALTDDFGKAKVAALRERIARVNPQCEVAEIEDFVTEDGLDEPPRWLSDFVIDVISQIRVKAAMVAYSVQHKQPFIISGDTGGQKSPVLIQTAGLSRVTHDPLLSNLRYTLHKRYGFNRDTKEKMRMPCAYSTENITPPQSSEACSTDAAPQGLSCTGHGTSMLMTVSFGLYYAQAAVEHIAGRKRGVGEDDEEPVF